MLCYSGDLRVSVSGVSLGLPLDAVQVELCRNSSQPGISDNRDISLSWGPHATVLLSWGLRESLKLCEVLLPRV